MKHIIYKLGVFLLFSMVSTSCNFLELEPKIILTDDFYTTEKSLDFGLAGIYGVLSSTGMYGSDYSLHISNPDDLCYQNRDPDGSSRVYRYTHNASDENVTAAWEKTYAGIKNANNFMVAIENSKFDKNDLYYSEARFLRAFYHFLLAQAWGDVPLRVTPVLLASASQIVGTPQEDILKWVVEEMEIVWDNFDENDHRSNNGAPSRITQSTIEGILARVYLFMAGDSVDEIEITGFAKKELYAKSAFWSKKVIDRNFHKLNTSYSQVFINMIKDEYDREFHESMWEVEFFGDRSSGFEWSNGRIGDVIGFQCSNNDNNFSQWNCNYSYGLYNASIKLWDLYHKDDRIAAEYKKDNFDNMDDRSMWNMPPYSYEGRTVKKSVSGIEDDIVYEKSYDKAPYVYDKKPSFTVKEDKSYDGIDKGRDVGARFAAKWRREVEYEGQNTAKSLFTPINFPILRYSDVLLMYAEASTRATGVVSQLAYDYVVEVRSRAKIETVDKGEISDEELFVTFVLNERARELAFEGLRKYDLIRTGTFVKAMNKYADLADDRCEESKKYGYASMIGSRVKEKHIYLPIPTAELSVNKLMKQNDKW